MATELLAIVRAEIEARRAQLRPAAEEYEQLLAAAGALEEDVRKAAPTATAPAATKRPRAAKRATAVKRTISAKTATAPTAKKTPATKKTLTAKAPAAEKAQRERPLAQQAIVAALEHGSHTVAELTVVSALSGSIIREGLRGLIKAGAVKRAKRDGKAAYALAGD